MKRPTQGSAIEVGLMLALLGCAAWLFGWLVYG
jgi:hypothetical protein